LSNPIVVDKDRDNDRDDDLRPTTIGTMIETMMLGAYHAIIDFLAWAFLLHSTA